MLKSKTGPLRVFSAVIFVLLLTTSACGKLSETLEKIGPALTVLPPQTDQSVDESVVYKPYCVDNPEKIHSVGESIARNYDIPYKDVIDFYCDGYEFEEILLALETGVQSEVATWKILKMRDNGLSWNEIWREVGLIE